MVGMGIKTGSNGRPPKTAPPAPPRPAEQVKDEPPPIPEEEVLRYHHALLAYPPAMAVLLYTKGLTVGTVRRNQLGIDGDNRSPIPTLEPPATHHTPRRTHPSLPH